MANDFKGVSSIFALKFYESLSMTSTPQTVTPAGGFADQDLSIPFAGSIVGLAAEHVTASTVGLTLTVYANSTAAGALTISKDAKGDGYATFQPGLYPFSVDDDITVKASLASGAVSDEYGATSVWVYVQIGSSAT